MLLYEIETYSDVVWVLLYHFDQQVLVVLEFGVTRVIVPSQYLNSILFLAAEVLPQIINDH